MSIEALFEVHWSDYSADLLAGLLWTLKYTAVGFAGAAALGLVLALIRLSPVRILRLPAAVYTELFKNVPLLAVIFLTYFGLPSAGIRLDVFEAGGARPIPFFASSPSGI